MVIGETIIDEYVYCNPLGKSGKEPYLAFKELNREMYLGGAAAISRQLLEFSEKLDLVSMIGEKQEGKSPSSPREIFNHNRNQMPVFSSSLKATREGTNISPLRARDEPRSVTKIPRAVVRRVV